MKTQPKVAPVKKDELSREALLLKLKEQNDKDVLDCETEIKKLIDPVLAKYGCELTTAGQWFGSQIKQSIAVIKVN